MKNNPFVSETFTTIWSTHFNASKPGVNFKFLKDVAFVKSGMLPLYYNVGKNITNGMSYVVNPEEKDFRGKAFLMHDVPSYFNLECFNISYSIYNEPIEKKAYQVIMDGFKGLLTKRFHALEKDNDILGAWDYYYDLIFEMLQEKRALLIVISNDDKPIGVSLSFLSDTTMFYAITSFDTDYYRFNLGHTTIIKLFNWCFDNGYTIYDFSKGEYEYKNRWTNKEYIYENHILYDSKSMIASAVAKFVKSKYALKQYLRDKNVNEKYVKLKFLLKGKKTETVARRKYTIANLEAKEDTSAMELIDLKRADFSFLKAIVYDELYKKPEAISGLQIYETKNLDNSSYYVVGEEVNYKIIFD